ncbi:NUDIX domain-containing protein [Candidatus Dojkabacteria bacterium]|nr:NUDIX domain-containing protein [Candidatus Dojkabacteria bacterium]
MNEDQLNKPYRKGVNAIVVDENNDFLLIQKNGYKDNEWNFLGGGREEGETLEQNLFRELNEEIGSSESDFEMIGISTHKIEYDYPADTYLKVNGGKYRGQSYDQVVLRFIGDKNKLVFTTEEFRGHKWAKANELITHLTFPNQYKNHKSAIEELLPEVKV